MKIRRATPNESDVLTAVAHAAKRHWNYPETWIAHWKADLTITSEFIANNEVFVATENNRILGCCALVLSEIAELEHMWIDPNYMGHGIGRALFEYTKCRATELGFDSLELSADPNAAGFYERMGARPIGIIQADVEGTARVLPRMKIEFRVPRSGRNSRGDVA